MNVKQLRALIAVHEQGSFSEAADLLGTVQSNVSAHVAKLEKELGVVLIERSTGQLTAEGEAVVARGYAALRELEAAWDDISSLNAELAGTVRIGVIGTTARWLTPALVSAVRDTFPAMRLIISDGTNTSLIQSLESGRIDLAVLTMPAAGKDLATEPLFTERMTLVVPRSKERDPFYGRRTISIAALKDLPILLPAPGTNFRNELDRAARRQGFELMAVAELDGVRLIASLAFDGHGLAILPSSAVPPHLMDRMRLVVIEDIPPRTVGVAWRARTIPSASSRAVVTIIERIAAKQDLAPEGISPAQAPHERPAAQGASGRPKR